MQTVMLFAAKAFTAIKGAGAAASAAGGSGAAAAAGGSKLLAGLRFGTSAISALSTFSQARAQAADLEADAFSQDLQARQEYIQAQEKATAIQRNFNQTVEDQQAAAAASGISISSGSVVAARQAAQTDADRQLTIARNGADLNAALRRGRAAALRRSASMTGSAGGIGGLTQIAGALIDMKGVK